MSSKSALKMSVDNHILSLWLWSELGQGKGKGKAFPVQPYGAGPEGSGRLRLPHSVTPALEGGRLSAIRTVRLYHQEYPGTHFKRLSRPGAHGMVGCDRKNPKWHHLGLIPGPSGYATPGPSWSETFWKSVEEVHVSLKYTKNIG
jgi:hypothetical protein